MTMKNARKSVMIDPTPSVRGQPTWEMADLYPTQGTWTEEEYLDLDVMRLIEFDNGVLEFLPMPTHSHQGISGFLYFALTLFLQSFDPSGSLRYAPLKIRVRKGKYREADLLYMSGAHQDRCHEKFWEGADLVIEIVSPGRKNQDRDFVKKRKDYARALIPEYWIIDPETKNIIVLTLRGKGYAVHGEFGVGDTATSVLLTGFGTSVDKVLAAGQKRA
jgi:Uma2 family endonuclease